MLQGAAMSNDDDVTDDRKGEQLGLGLTNNCAPPATRAECADIPRPCNRYACKENLHVETERAGRPYGGHAPEPKLFPIHMRKHTESCAMDLAERGGMTPKDVAAQLGTTPERVGQLEERARTKVGLALLLEQVLDEHVRSRMPKGTSLETIYPANVDDAGHVHVRLVFAVDKMHPRRNRRVVVTATGTRKAPERNDAVAIALKGAGLDAKGR